MKTMRCRFILPLICMVFLLPLTVTAEIVNEEWVARYNGPEDMGDHANAITVDGAGNVYVTGFSYDSAWERDYATIKYDTSGIQQWINIYNGPANKSDHAKAVAVDGAGNVYVTGYSWDGADWDFVTIKYNASGIQQWVMNYNGPANGDDYGRAIAVDGAGNVYVTGESHDSGSVMDYATVKYDTNGTQQWVKRYNNGSWDYAYDIAVDGAGNVYITGESMDSGGTYDYATVKYDTSGTQQWVERYDGPANHMDRAAAIAVDSAGNVSVTGYSYNGTDMDYATVFYNTSGTQQWVNRYNNSGYDEAYAIAVDGTGSVYVTGRSTGVTDDYATVKYDNTGSQQWVSRYDAGDQDHAKAVAVDGAGNVYVTGQSFGGDCILSDGTCLDYATIKYNTSGTQQWVKRYNGPINRSDSAVAIAVDGTGNAYVTGNSGTSDNGADVDYATIKYSTSIPVSDNDGDGYDNTVDCDDNDFDVNPGATEVCGDGIDNDCVGGDEACPNCDIDGDGFDAYSGFGFECFGNDCNDYDPAVNPGATEICGDGIDNDCSGGDEVCPPVDADGDGYNNTVDCDDNDFDVNPGAAEVCGDGIDNDCIGGDEACPNCDIDGDGFDAYSGFGFECFGNDCNDYDPAVNPGATEICGDGIDNDCTGGDETCAPVDADNDGYDETVDCNDNDDSINPGACDIKGDGIDQDCNDEDRTKGKACPGTPAEDEICDDGIDNDGDGKTDCSDRDCRNDAACSGGGGDTEICTDGIDNDGDGKTDCADKGDCRKDPAC